MLTASSKFKLFYFHLNLIKGWNIILERCHWCEAEESGKFRQDSQSATSKSTRRASTGSCSSVVTNMVYTTPCGKSGWYSGEVDEYGIPNGDGKIRFKNGQQYCCEWTRGYMTYNNTVIGKTNPLTP